MMLQSAASAGRSLCCCHAHTPPASCCAQSERHVICGWACTMLPVARVRIMLCPLQADTAGRGFYCPMVFFDSDTPLVSQPLRPTAARLVGLPACIAPLLTGLESACFTAMVCLRQTQALHPWGSLYELLLSVAEPKTLRMHGPCAAWHVCADQRASVPPCSVRHVSLRLQSPAGGCACFTIGRSALHAGVYASSY
jgi:hypothetical protein